VVGSERGTASNERSVSRKILAAKTGWNWIGHGNQRVPSYRIQTNARCEKQLRGEGNRRLSRSRPRQHKLSSDFFGSLDEPKKVKKGSTFWNVARAARTHRSLLTGLQAVCQVQGWKVQQIVFVGGTCGSIHVGSFNRNMKALGVLDSKWDPIRKNLARRLIEEQDKVLRSYFAQKGGTRGRGGDVGN
jgi:hypothetical protein